MGALSSTVGLSKAAGQDASGLDQPMVLDLSKNLYTRIASIPEIASLAGRQEFDGLPFQIDGQVHVYGKTPETNMNAVYPDSAVGIGVDRKFDELHLIHHTTWPDVQGEIVAYICLDYADDTKFMFPIRYGVHVLDWYDLPSYDGESVTDPYTKICWRHPPHGYNAPLRLFKSTFKNPFADKTVRSINVLSTRNLAAYCLEAATVANSKTVPQPELPSKKGFDAKLTLRVVDDENDEPVEGALVLPSMTVEDFGLVGSPFRNSAAGEGEISYPTKTTRSLSVHVSKAGYEDAFQNWGVPAPTEFTIRLQRSEAE